jgi:tetratricopeptide (TPR) repeat protein
LEAIQTARTLPESASTERSGLLTAAAVRQIELADITGALRTTQAIQEAENRDIARFEIVAALLLRSEHKIAVGICNGIENTDTRDSALSSVAESMATNGDLESALAVVTRIEDSSSRSSTLLLVVLTQASLKKFESTNRLTAVIDRAPLKLQALCETATSYLDLRQNDAARETYLEAQRVAKTAHLASHRLIVLQAKLGEMPQALVAATEVSDPLERDRIVKEIVFWVAGQGRIREALVLLPSIKNDFEYAATLREIAIRQADTGDVVGGLRSARSIADHAIRNECLRQLATIQIGKCDCSGAIATLTQAVEAARRVDVGGGTQVILLRETAIAQTQAGDLDSATQTFRRANAAIEAYEDPHYRAKLIATVAKAQAANGLSKDVKEWARKQPMPMIRARALIGLVEGMLAIGCKN